MKHSSLIGQVETPANELVAPVLEQAAILPAAIVLIPLMLLVSVVLNGAYVIGGLFDRPKR